MTSSTASLQQKLLLGLFTLILLILTWQVLHLFLAPVAWAGILAYVSWPLYQRIDHWCGERHNLSAFLMTLLLATLLILPVVWVMLLMQSEASALYQSVLAALSKGQVAVPEPLRRIPWLGEELQDLVASINADPNAIKSRIAGLLQHWSGEISALVGGVGRNLGKLAFALLTAFFFYRDGRTLMRQLQGVLRRYLGTRVDAYLAAAGNTTRAVVYGIVLTALAQGLLAGIGYAVAGAPSPVFLAAITTLIAMIPFGTPFAWGSVCLWLLMQNQFWAATGLFLWGTFVVSWVDNIIRPLVISSATAIPFLFVMFGVLGGLAAFGMVGLFIGPVILAVVYAIWQEWVADSIKDDSPLDKS